MITLALPSKGRLKEQALEVSGQGRACRQPAG